MEIGDRLKRVRTEMRGLSQDRLEELSGVSKTQISNCERGKRGLGTKALFAVARALKINAEWLLTGDGSMQDAEDASTEIRRAVFFLRGQLPDAFLDGVLASDYYQGPQWTRDQLVPMIRELYVTQQRAGERDDTDEVLEMMGDTDDVSS